MATLKAVIVPAKALKDNKHKVRISVAHNGEFRYILTDIILNSEKEFKNGQIVKRPDAAILNTKLRGILQRYQSTLDELEYVNGLTCPELVYQLKNAGNNKRRTLGSIYHEYIDYRRLQPGSVDLYKSLFLGIKECIGEMTLVENITHSTVLSYDKFLRKKKLKPTTIRNKVMFLRILVNFAKKCGYVQYRVDPFVSYDLPKAEVRQAWLTVDDVRIIRDYNAPNKRLAKCRDLFMLSYYLGGINMADLMDINFDEQKSVLHYVRKKTEHRQKLNKFVEFAIPEEALTIINRYKGDDGRLALTAKQRADRCHKFFVYNMKVLGGKLGIPNLIYYSARKSFSQHAYVLGVDTSVIDYILGHRVDKDGSSLYNYITVTPDMATKAVRKVLDNLK